MGGYTVDGSAALMNSGWRCSASSTTAPSSRPMAEPSAICALRFTGAPWCPAVMRPSTQSVAASSRSRSAAAVSALSTPGILSIMAALPFRTSEPVRDRAEQRAVDGGHRPALIRGNELLVAQAVGEVEDVEADIVLRLVI